MPLKKNNKNESLLKKESLSKKCISTLAGREPDHRSEKEVS